MERSLGLIAAGGALPARAAAEARRQGWRVVAFTFDTAPGLEAASDVLVPSALADIPATIQRLMVEQVTAALFVGKFAKQRLVEADTSDHSVRRLAGDGLSDGALGGLIATTLGQLGIEVLDQRPFLSPWMAAPGVLTTRPPTAEEWTEIRGGLALARQLAAHGVGQTVVRFWGATVAVEAIEGTDEVIRRGTRLSGPGAVVVKGVAPSHDYRFDTPAVGPTTLDAMIEGRATALAIEGGRVLVVDRDEVIRRADDAGIAVVSVDGDV